jgi:5'-deoxynucleotidase YfbR-like HD superfamily hydrolase
MSDSKHFPPARAWQRMLSGRRLDLLEPDPNDIAIEDIAHGLARVARWNGQTEGAHAFSVAQHSLIVADIVSRMHPDFTAKDHLAALLHDAPEYVVGDLISPFKSAIGLDYKAFELRLLAAIHRRFSIPVTLKDDVAAAIKTADRIAAFYEATGLAGFSNEEANLYFAHDPLPDDLAKRLEKLDPLPANAAESNFLSRFAKLARS